MILVSHVIHPQPFFCDSTTAIQIANDQVKHELTKHIGGCFLHTLILPTIIHLEYVPSELQLADFFTKAQTRTT
jgi:hypothetical protein